MSRFRSRSPGIGGFRAPRSSRASTARSRRSTSPATKTVRRRGFPAASSSASRLLLLDEPLSNLDAQLRDEMRNELKRLQREIGITTVYVTHDQAEALALSDRLAVMDRGRIVQVGTPHEIYFHPVDAFVARFV